MWTSDAVSGIMTQKTSLRAVISVLVYLQMVQTREDRSKFEGIYLAYRGLMYYTAYKYLHQEQDAEDVVQQAFVKIAEMIDQIEPACPKTRQLVVTITENRAIDLLRSRGRHPEAPLSALTDSRPDRELEGEGLLASCILKLPPLQRQVIMLKYHHGYTLREIAKLLGISLSWAQKVDQRAKKQLADLYRKEGGTL